MKPIGYAVVGVGYFGSELARIIQQEAGAQVIAVLDPVNADTIAAELNCDGETDLEALCARPDVDAVIVASPNDLHKEPVLCAARHGKHVFCEKPIALSFADCSEMVKACSDAHVFFMAGHVMNFFSGVRTAKRLIAEGRIGRVLYCHAARTGWEDKKQTVSWKKMRQRSGGHLYHHIHELDCIQFLMGPAKGVTMAGGNVAHQGAGYGDEDDLLLITLEFGNGTYATLEYGSAFRWSEHYLLIEGTGGAIRLDMQNVGGTLRTPEGDTHFLLHMTKEEDEDRAAKYRSRLGGEGAVRYGKPGDTISPWLHSIMVAEMQYFHDVLRGKPVDPEFCPLLDGTAARDSIATADACVLSLKENRKVYITEITDSKHV